MHRLILRWWLLVLSCMAGMVYAEEAQQDQAVDEEITVIDKRYNSVSIPRSFGSSRIRDWQAQDNRTLIIEIAGGDKYKATFMSPCTGIDFTDTIAFSTMGPFELDSHTSVLLPGGERCYFKDLAVYTKEEEERDQQARKDKDNNKEE